MQELAVGLALVLVVVAVPALRGAALSLLGLVTIIAAGTAVIAGLVWALYVAKPWMIDHRSAVAEETPIPAQQGTATVDTPEEDLVAAIAGEEEQHFLDEQQRHEEEKHRLEILVARVRVLLEEDRKLAAQAASYPLPAGVSYRLGDIMAIRIPAWRDTDVAAAQKEAIRTWLQSIGLTAEETATIVTEKAWGSLYDLWRAGNPTAAPLGPRVQEPEVATAPSPDQTTNTQDPPPDAGPSPVAAPAATTEIPQRRSTTGPPIRSAPLRRPETPRPATPARPSSPQPEVGPFGF